MHDCANARNEFYLGELHEGYVLTVEPGLYFQPNDLTVPEEYRGIGVRIEDDILVTADGSRNLSAGLPRAADDVEAWMAESGASPPPTSACRVRYARSRTPERHHSGSYGCRQGSPPYRS